MKRKKKSKLEKSIELIAKKKSIFTLNDIEVLVEKTKLEIIPVLNLLISKKRIKQDGETYIFIPPKAKKVENKEEGLPVDSLIHTLPFRPVRPKEVYLRNINQMDGFIDYFFSTPATKRRIKRILKLLKDAHGKKGVELEKILKEHNTILKTYQNFKKDVSDNGLKNLVGATTQEPGEIFCFYKEYYLSPMGLTSIEAWELAIQRFEKLIKMRLNRSRITRHDTMLKWVKKEFSQEQIEKFKNYNFSEFDVENMFKE